MMPWKRDGSVIVSFLSQRNYFRHHRACPGDPRLSCVVAK
jgi:hypothetical protein